MFDFDIDTLTGSLLLLIGGSDPVKDARSMASAREKETLMSANRTDDNDRRNIAWRVFREADLGYTETVLVGESYEAHERLLGAVVRIDYGDLTLTRIARGCRAVVRPHFQQWMGRAKTSVLSYQRHLAVYALVSELQRLLGYGPLFGMIDDQIFLGRFRRDHDELPLSDAERLTPETTEFVDLWGDADGRRAMVRYGCGRYDYVAGHIDELAQAGGHMREAFRRLAKEPLLVAA